MQKASGQKFVSEVKKLYIPQQPLVAIGKSGSAKL